jgi:polysaccharide export outer membrane protein
MKCLLNGSLASLIFVSVMLISPANLYAITPSPQMIAQLQQLSPQQQQALAKQYGFKLPRGFGAGDLQQADPGVVGEPGERIDVFDRIGQSTGFESLYGQNANSPFPEGLGKEDDGELKRFGLSIFDRDISTFSPVDDLPVPANYSLGPGDTVNVLLFGKEQEQLILTINRDGGLQFPRLGSISVAGLTFAELKAVIENRVNTQFVGTNAVVSIGKLRSINVFLAGEIVAPGSYSVSGLSTVTQVLYAAGGVTDIGSMRNIQVKRQGQEIVTFDLYDLLILGDTSNDIRLSSGDTVFVPIMKSQVTIDGEVRRPALYETVANDNVGSLLQMAGGIAARGYGRLASISRYAANESSRSRVQLNLNDKSDLETPVIDGDFLEVGRVKEDIRSQVLLRGAVARPGGYAWKEGIRVSDLLSSIDDDLLGETDLNTGLVVRRTGQGLEIDVLGLSLVDSIDNAGSDSDLELQPKDEVLIFSLPYFNESYKKLREGLESDGGRADEDEFFDLEDDLLTGDRRSAYIVSGLDRRLASEEEEEEEEKEDRQDLIEEVVFRLEAQARTPAETNLVTVSGDVRLPGTYPLLKGGKMAQLIELAGGFEASAFLERAEVTRLTFKSDGTADLKTIGIPLADILSGSSDFQLMARDQVQIRRIPNWSYGDVVTLTGAVVSPGDYPIAPGESLFSVLERAGGLNQVAFADGAVFIKTSVREREQEQIRKLVSTIQRNQISRSRTRENEENFSSAESNIVDREELIDLLLDEEVGGRVVIDLPRILGGDLESDVQLQAGDSLYVPEFSSTVSVIGEVLEPGTFRYISERTAADYIEFAAGASTRALSKDIYVVRANGGVVKLGGKRSLFRFGGARDLEVRPGDTIVVPVDEGYQPTLTKYREVTTVIFQSIASLFPLFRL